jgi:hypothetical protein
MTLTPYTIIGIDPSLTATGISRVAGTEDGKFLVLRCETIKTDARSPMVDRLFDIVQGVKHGMMWQEGQLVHGFHGVAIEDPSAQKRVRSKKQSVRDIAVMHLGIGAVIATVLGFVSDPVLYDVDQWMPKVGPARRQYIMPKEQMIRWILSNVVFPPRPPNLRKTAHYPDEHMIMAAGIARFHILQLRHEATRRAMGITL